MRGSRAACLVLALAALRSAFVAPRHLSRAPRVRRWAEVMAARRGNRIKKVQKELLWSGF